MLRWMLLSATLAACSRDMSDREYCTRRQMAWEMAFPNLPQTDAMRTDFIDKCTSNVAFAHESGALDRSRKCMDEHIRGNGKAREQWEAFEHCEGRDPTRPPPVKPE